METVDVELPLALLRTANPDERTLPGEVARLVALELCHEDRVSLGRAAELCQTPLAALMDFAAKHGVPPLRYSYEALEVTARVFPVPAPASTSTGPSVASTASRCCGLRSSRRFIECGPARKIDSSRARAVRQIGCTVWCSNSF